MILRAFSNWLMKKNSYNYQELILGKSNGELEVSFIIPVYNQEDVIIKNLVSLIRNISLTSELILINDGSEDQTDATIKKFLENYINSNHKVKKISYFSSKFSRFETFSDHFGIEKATGKYVIEVQADMEILEKNFDSKMVEVLKNNPDIFILSGRGIMPFAAIFESFAASRGNEALINTNILKALKFHIGALRRNKPKESDQSKAVENGPVFPSSKEYSVTKKAGRLGRLIEMNLSAEDSKVYVGETVMRGPICFSKVNYNLVGGLNYKAFFLGFDEHDLNLRARIEHNLKAAYKHVNFKSPLDSGTMRKKRSIKSKIDLLLAIKRTSPYLRETQLYKSTKLGGDQYNDHEIRSRS